MVIKKNRQKRRKLLILQVIPDDRSRAMSFRLPYWMIKASVYLFLFVCVGMGFLAVYYVKYKIVQTVQVKNQLREKQIKIEVLEKEVQRLAMQEQVIQNILTTFYAPDGLEKAVQPENTKTPLISRAQLQTYVKQVQEVSNLKPKQNLPERIPDIWPVAGIISQGFLESKVRDKSHSGIDIIAKSNSLVVSTAKGIVVHSGWDRDLGKSIKIDHGEGRNTVYAHLNRLDVKIGDHVQKGSVVGTVGSTGHSIGPHLHYEIYENQRPVDPAIYLEWGQASGW